MDQEHIDTLLERYLTLLDEYTQLRDRLSRSQSDVFHSIARANFSGERSMRYGRDHYDERMQASRRLNICEGDEGEGREFEVVNTAKEETKEDPEESVDEEQTNDDEPDAAEVKEEDTSDEKPKKAKEKKPVDPLRWFGLFAPMPLRNAQAQSIEAVESIIPRLVTVKAEMHNVEIEVGRARKKRAKAAEKKTKSEVQSAATAVEAS